MSTLAVILLVVAAASTLLGGPLRIIIVAGNSMLGTYNSGDLLVTWNDGGAEPGDIIVYTVPEPHPAAGTPVVHRVTDTTDTGAYITQGDNNDHIDPWEPTDDDLIGQPVLVVPHGSLAVTLLRSTWVFGLAVAALVTALLWPRNPDDADGGNDSAGQDAPDGEEEVDGGAPDGEVASGAATAS